MGKGFPVGGGQGVLVGGRQGVPVGDGQGGPFGRWARRSLWEVGKGSL